MRQENSLAWFHYELYALVRVSNAWIKSSWMVRRSKTSVFENSIIIASKLPWWLCLSSVVTARFILHAVTIPNAIAPKQIGDLNQVIISQMFRTSMQLGQYLLPAIFLLEAVVSDVTRLRRSKLFDGVAEGCAKAMIHDVSWKQFEQLVGESFRGQGFSMQESEARGADSGCSRASLMKQRPQQCESEYV